MSDNKLLEELKRLYALAVLRPEEENDEGRKNEARNAAFLLFNKARKGGVKIKFEVPGAEPNRASTAPHAAAPPPVHDDLFAQVLDDLMNGTYARPPGVPQSRIDANSPFRAPRRGRTIEVQSAVYMKMRFGAVCISCRDYVSQGEYAYWMQRVGVACKQCGEAGIQAAADAKRSQSGG